MPRSKPESSSPAAPKKQGRIAQLRSVFRMTRKADPSVVWWMLFTILVTLLVGFGLGTWLGHPIYLTILSIPVGFLVAMIVLARKAEKAAFTQIAGQPGSAGAALGNLRRGWNVEKEPVAIDPRTQDMVFRAVGRPGVVLVTEGPLPRATRLAEKERKRIARVLGQGVPITIVHAGQGENQVPLPKIATRLARLRPTLTKTEVSEVARRLRALGGVKPPIPKGVDPLRLRPDRKATRGR
jgi:hypothetical protein